MNPEQKFFLECLSDHIKCKKINVTTDLFKENYSGQGKKNGNDADSYFPIMNLENLKQMVLTQNAGGIIYVQTRRFKKLHLAFQKSFLENVFLSVNRADILKEIIARFQTAGIDLICMKGTVLRDCYPIPELRSMGDIDFIIRTKDRDTTNHILIEEMRFSRFIDNHAVWTYCFGDFMIEVHDHMFYENLAIKYDYREYFDHVWEHCHHGSVFGIEADNLYIPDENFHFLFLMVHTAKHIINSGSGFRPYMDMVLMTKKYDLDWNWIENELKNLELLHFTRTCFALCERWFNIQMPLGEKRLDEGFYQEITEKTFEDGIFGLDNKQNVGAHSAKEIKRAEQGYLKGAILLTLKKIFPPYEDMQLIPWYAWVDERPWLLPAAWIYRWFYCFIRKRKQSIDLLTEPFSKKKEIESREVLINSWGL